MEKSIKFLQFVAESVVANPEEINIESKTDERGVLLTLHVAPPDVGRIIGREGQTARAIRTLLKAVGMQEGARVAMRVYDPRNPNGVQAEETFSV